MWVWVMISDTMEASVRSFSVKGLWGFKDIIWKDIHPDINILVGVNGCGKSTLLNIMYEYYQAKNETPQSYQEASAEPAVLPENVVPVLLRPLDALLNGTGAYLPQALSRGEAFRQVLDLLDGLFAGTAKKAGVEDGELVFYQAGQKLSFAKLSTGEKQLLLILLRVFLTQGQPAIVFLDEPELSLHISWQRRIIDVIQQLNPQTQLFITSHSPSIFSSGWGDKVVYFEDIEFRE